MQFKLFDGKKIVTSITADNEQDAWKVFKRAGIRNSGGTFSLINTNEKEKRFYG